jgi:uncharacterized protein (TIGR00369 family)
MDRRARRQGGHDRRVPKRTADELTAYLHTAFPDRSGVSSGTDGTGARGRGDGYTVVEYVDDESIRIRSSAGDRHLRPGATVVGPTLFALVDAVAWLLTLAQLDPGHEAVTAAVSMQFLRRPPAGTLLAEGKLLRMGRRFSVVDVLVYAEAPQNGGGGDPADDTDPHAPVAQATVTYAPI